MNKVHYSSKKVEWETPQELFDELNKEFSFTLDVCATKENKKCDRFFSKESGMHGNGGLDWSWDGERVWMNPPYGREIGKWVHKLAISRCEIGVALLPARTDTKWFHIYIYNNKKAKIRFLRGRLKFGGAKNSAPFPSMLVIFTPPNKLLTNKE